MTADTATLPLKARQSAASKRSIERSLSNRPGLARRVRAWIRHFLGLPEMRDAIEALLHRSADQQQQLVQVSTELTAMSPFRKELADYVSGVERGLEVQRVAIEDLRAAVAKESAALVRSRSELRALTKMATAARSDVLNELRAGDFVLDTARMLRTLAPLVKRSGDLELLRTMNDAVERLPALLVEEAELVRNRLADELRGGQAILELKSSVRQLAEWAAEASDIRLIGSVHEAVKLLPEVIAHEAELARRHVADDLREGAVAVELKSSLRQLAEWAEQASDIRLIGSVHEAVKLLPEVIAHEAELARRHVADDLREGAVAVELISSLRRLAEWAEQAFYIRLIGPVHEAIKRLPGVIAHEAELAGRYVADELRGGPLSSNWYPIFVDWPSGPSKPAIWRLSELSRSRFANYRATLNLPARGRATSLDRLQIHASSTSTKLDSLMSRETIPVPGAGLVLSRNSSGFLAIQDDDLAAIAYYSSGELPSAARFSSWRSCFAPETLSSTLARTLAHTLFLEDGRWGLPAKSSQSSHCLLPHECLASPLR